MKQQINFRASALTARQLTKLAKRTGMNQTEVISVAIDRMYREEKMDESSVKFQKFAKWAQDQEQPVHRMGSLIAEFAVSHPETRELIADWLDDAWEAPGYSEPQGESYIERTRDETADVARNWIADEDYDEFVAFARSRGIEIADWREPKNDYPYGIPRDCRFIRVVGDDGVFYDLVYRHAAEKHIARLREDGYEAKGVSQASVPPCKFRDFAGAIAAYAYCDGTWKNGTGFYFPDAKEGE